MVRIFFVIISFICLINAQEISSSVSTKNISITESIIFTIKISDVDENPSVDISKIEDNPFKEMLKSKGVTSIYNVPIKTLNGKIIGFIFIFLFFLLF